MLTRRSTLLVLTGLAAPAAGGDWGRPHVISSHASGARSAYAVDCRAANLRSW